MDVDAARLLTMQAAGTMDRGERRQASFEAAKAKTYATDVAMDVTTEAVQVHGGVGYSTDYPVERFMREAKGTQIYEGTNEINRQVILNHLYG
jgi:alkylation response protein AidB-like acyl-CoA dehydrogenase